MTATAAMVTRLRRMVAEPDAGNGYTDGVLTDAIERYPVLDAAGRASTDTGWAADYDLSAAAAEVWSEKAAVLAGQYDFTADGATFRRDQAHAHALKQARHHAARRQVGTVAIVRSEEAV